MFAQTISRSYVVCTDKKDVSSFGAHTIFCDDPVKGAQDADSPSTRRRLINEFKASLLTRRMPGASVVVVMTRWSEQDIAAELLAGGGWLHVNVPAVSAPGVPDSLDRPPGVPMATALGEFDSRRSSAKSGRARGRRCTLACPRRRKAD
jgi:hypothetical protein